jgi:periplasmic divalent cation tolerance protein
MRSSNAPSEHQPSTHGVLILSTAPDILLAKRIAHILIEEKLAACVQLTPPLLSIYEWEGEIQGADEVGLIIKTTDQVAQQAVERLVELHPYDIPEAVVMPITGGHIPYLHWLDQQTQRVQK